ncbi:inactive pancreatic lipase-related protein 1-like isoform X2 [Ruditapes philippinarum]|uniref:inactive pancreatic lipase-related protein 1-like isoform X2 n=1 Tax=Ruditapes philippinarum TaxID=129788 RepID=UPI00295BEFA0|nr:inactive pancreatic lipase-related protein 1-like isoform X2 [Ruditapes philippinarum]
MGSFLPLCLSVVLAIAETNGLFFESKVCYDGVGCFHANHPFDNSFGELPDSPEDMEVRTFLWTRQNPVEAQELKYQDIASIQDSNFDASRQTKVLIHGFMSSKDTSPVIANLSVAFLKQGDYNVIGVDWSKGAKKLYPKAVANTRLVGAVVAQLIKVLLGKFEMDVKTLHVIGHSLGAHTAGYVGTRIPGIPRITGLDPAGPLFTKTDPAVHLDPSDALFVDAIHSDGAPIEDAGFGTLSQLGHMDFYPNGGQIQPGCPPPVKTTVEQLLTFQFTKAFDSVSCAHDRAIWYFIESVLNTNCQFTSYPCSSWESFKAGNCTTCGDAGCPVMGINSYTRPIKGAFYLQTNSQTPFCQSN